MLISILNIEETILSNKELKVLFPDLKNLFDRWIVTKRTPSLRQISQRLALDILEKLSESTNVSILEKYFNETVIVQTIDHHIAKNCKANINCTEECTKDISYGSNISISRDAEQFYLSVWK